MVWPLLSSFNSLPCFDVLRWLHSKVSSDVFDFICVVILGIWSERNSFIHKGNCCGITPPLGELKLNTDAAVHPFSNQIGLGAIIHDEFGLVVAALSKPFVSSFSTETGDYLALREGLLLAKNLGMVVHRVESYTANVISGINSVDDSLEVAGLIISDVQSFCSEVGVVNCYAIPRNRNKVAHSLASPACSSFEESLRLDKRPSCVVSLL
ncbi:hypothetical protein ACOSQ3_007571 [Xanthoceras sorbifolium]